MYKNCREELLAVITAYVKENGVNEFTRAEAIKAMCKAGGKYTDRTVSYRCCANIVRYYKPMHDDFEKIGDGNY